MPWAPFRMVPERLGLKGNPPQPASWKGVETGLTVSSAGLSKFAPPPVTVPVTAIGLQLVGLRMKPGLLMLTEMLRIRRGMPWRTEGRFSESMWTWASSWSTRRVLLTTTWPRSKGPAGAGGEGAGGGGGVEGDPVGGAGIAVGEVDRLVLDEEGRARAGADVDGADLRAGGAVGAPPHSVCDLCLRATRDAIELGDQAGGHVDVDLLEVLLAVGAGDLEDEGRILARHRADRAG